MQLGIAARRLGVALLPGMLLLSATADATTYGDTAYASTFNVTACADTVPLSLPVSVSVNSRIHVSARAAYSANGTNLTQGIVWVELRDSGDTTTLAASQWAWGVVAVNSTLAFIDSNGLLHSGTGNDAPTATIFVAAPGNYLLKMHVQTGMGTCTGNPVFLQPTLSYILLSSVFDRVFGDGFEAMLGDGHDVAMAA